MPVNTHLKSECFLACISSNHEIAKKVIRKTAIKYSPENAAIEISVFQKNNSVEFTVRDSGNGIDEKYLPKIFDRYYKVPGTHERSGTGLGLAISREFIESQHGVIWAKSYYWGRKYFWFLFGCEIMMMIYMQ